MSVTKIVWAVLQISDAKGNERIPGMRGPGFWATERRHEMPRLCRPLGKLIPKISLEIVPPRRRAAPANIKRRLSFPECAQRLALKYP